MEVLCEESALQGPENPVREVKDGSIDFDNVSFKYAKTAERMALSGIDLHIRSGETIGIIGGTDSSKSTLIQLISRRMTPLRALCAWAVWMCAATTWRLCATR